eukprot:TRINITY_DN8788_c0_g1::TRINITY_DN8788_c0_g1_i1::g.23943::m.23943 TRINITY_DN8788_c0_g1::TRINITY_DN8788_c0_g1_i1::g.23943  ORF type:complete len:506 (-),score=29.81,sp/Q9C0G6/DYH6_HUMAN/25.71/9e-28,AAA_6/PF12774.2/1.3e-14,RNA12/PF10443.4/0.71,RNA12/PF10443.4/7.5e+02 TRINITY_DN8788_c0_g1_i1:1717-3234(-)
MTNNGGTNNPSGVTSAGGGGQQPGKKKDDKGNTSCHMISSIVGFDQKLVFSEPFSFGGTLPEIVQRFEKSIEKSLRLLLHSAIRSTPHPTGYAADEFLDSFPAQIMYIANQVDFTQSLENVLFRTPWTEKQSALNEMLQTEVEVLEATAERIRPEDLPLHQNRVAALKMLITLSLQHRDIIMQILKDPPPTPYSWQWLRLFRYEYEAGVGKKPSKCIIRHGGYVYEYGFTFQGILPRVLYGKTIEAGVLSTTTAFASNMLGLTIQGPPSSGKRSLVHDMGKALGREIFFFDCNLSLTEDISLNLARWMSGVVAVGAWGVIGQVSTLPPQAMCLLANIIDNIASALRDKLYRACIGHRIVQLHPSVALFCTVDSPQSDSDTTISIPCMSSLSTNWRLPDALRRELRPVAMIPPDPLIIAEVTLYTEGFRFPADCSKGLVSVYKEICKRVIALATSLPVTPPIVPQSQMFRPATSAHTPPTAGGQITRPITPLMSVPQSPGGGHWPP